MLELFSPPQGSLGVWGIRLKGALITLMTVEKLVELDHRRKVSYQNRLCTTFSPEMVVKKYRKDIVEEQHDLRRIADIAIDAISDRVVKKYS